MKKRNRIEVCLVSKLDARVCDLAAVLGEPELQRCGDYYRTSWTFEHPHGERHWILLHLSTEPVSEGRFCRKHEMLTWNIYGETDEHTVLCELVRYVLDSFDFYCGEA